MIMIIIITTIIITLQSFEDSFKPQEFKSRHGAGVASLSVPLLQLRGSMQQRYESNLLLAAEATRRIQGLETLR